VTPKELTGSLALTEKVAADRDLFLELTVGQMTEIAADSQALRRQDEVDGASEQGDRSLCAPDSVGRSDVLRKSRGDRVRSHTLDRAPAVLSPRDSVISEHLRTGSNYPSAACALYQNRSRSRIRSLQNIGLPNQTAALSPMACAVL